MSIVDKIKALTKETGIYGLSTIIGRFLNFFLLPLYTKIFSRADYGVITNLYAFIGLFNIVFLYGMDVAYLKFASSVQDEKKKNVFATAFISVVLSSIILSSIFLSLNKDLVILIQIPEEFKNLIFLSIGILAFDAISGIPFAHLRLVRKAKNFALIKLANIILNVLLNVILILKYNLGIEAVFISNICASIFSFALLIPTIKINFRISFNFSVLKKMLNFALPLIPALFASMMIRMIDKPILMALTDAKTVGIYGANAKLGFFMMLVISMFQYAWQPFFLENAKDKEAKKMFSKILTLFLIVLSSIWVFLTLFIKDIVTIEIMNFSIIAPAFRSGLYIVPVILLGYLFYGMYVNFMAGIFIEEKTKFIPFITGAGGLTNVLLNILLIPYLGIMGAAIAMAASYLIMTLSLFKVGQKHYHIDYEFSKIFYIFLSLSITGGIYYFLETNAMVIISYKIILMFVFIGLLFAFKILNISEIKKIFTVLRKKG